MVLMARLSIWSLSVLVMVVITLDDGLPSLCLTLERHRVETFVCLVMLISCLPWFW